MDGAPGGPDLVDWRCGPSPQAVACPPPAGSSAVIPGQPSRSSHAPGPGRCRPLPRLLPLIAKGTARRVVGEASALLAGDPGVQEAARVWGIDSPPVGGPAAARSGVGVPRAARLPPRRPGVSAGAVRLVMGPPGHPVPDGAQAVRALVVRAAARPT